MSRSILFVGFLVDLRWCQAPPGVCCQSARRSGWRRLKVVLQSSAAIDGVSDSHRGLRRSIDSIRLVVYCTLSLYARPICRWERARRCAYVSFPLSFKPNSIHIYTILYILSLYKTGRRTKYYIHIVYIQISIHPYLHLYISISILARSILLRGNVSRWGLLYDLLGWKH